ncbi:carboxypeptidase-like regulatory domain-containing protein [Granulicella cerasi]|nr:carboxypeptidase-like regulatory domain-containing protein [Granulicella cerasi]
MPAFAQFESGVEATVVDPSGAAVPGATMSLTNQATHITNQATANGAGYLHILQLPVGTYTAEVKAPGFKAWKLTDIVVEGRTVRTVYPKLSLGSETTTVSVEADTQQIETSRGNIGRTLETKTVQESPMLGQNIYAGVATLAPGVTGLGTDSGNISAAGSVGTSSYNAESGYQINSAGQRQETNEFQVDGTPVNSNSRDGVTNITPHPETVQEMKVTALSFTADKGRQSGALIELFTKSGTNKFHGMVQEFHSDNALQSRTHFNNGKVPRTIRNDFGGAVGGPIFKDRTFFFGSLFWERSIQGQSLVRTAETQDFTNYVKTKYPNAIGTMFLTQAPVKVYPTSQFLNVAQVRAAYGALTTDTFSDFTGNVVGSTTVNVSVPINGFQGHLRLDHSMNDGRDKVFFSFFRNTTMATTADPRPILAYTNPNRTMYAKFDYVHAFSSSLVNDAGISFTRNYGKQDVNLPALPNIYYLGGISATFSQWGPSDWTQNNMTYQDALTWSHGRHTIKAGIDIDRQQDLDNFENGLVRPAFYFLSPLDLVTDLPFYQGGPVVDLKTQTIAHDLYQRVYMLYVAPFVQEDWKVNSRLTMNFGVRLDYFGHQSTVQNGHSAIAFFTPQGTGSMNTQIANGSMVVRGSNGQATYNAQYRVSPRVGFAYDVLGNGKLSVHGGYGIFSDKVGEYAYVNGMRTNPPGYANPSLNIYSGATRSQFTFQTSNSGAQGFAPPNGLSYQTDAHGGLVGTRTSVGGIDPNLQAPMVHAWALGVQQAVAGGWVLEFDYLGTASRKLYLQTNVNRYAGDAQQHAGSYTYLNQSFGSVTYGQNNNVANTNVGAFGVTHSFAHGWTMHATYTLSKSLDYISSNDNGVGGGETVFDAAHPERQYGRSDYDSRHRFSADAVWNIPGVKSSSIAHAITSGFTVSPIVILQSGQPFTVYTSAQYSAGGDYNGDGYNYDMPNVPSFGRQISAARSQWLPTANGGGGGVFKASAFAAPAPGTEGNLGRNTYNGPGYAVTNIALERKFPLHFLGEAGLFELRGEFLNAFNRVNLAKPVSDLSSTSFGMSTTQLLPRQIQLVAHIRF